MTKVMRTEKQWNHNVGTNAYPVTFLHEYAVALIWDMLTSNTCQVQLPILDGSLSDDLMVGVDKVIIPDSLQSIAGYIPDISLLNDARPIRCIEVIVTNPILPNKVTAIQNLGVEIIQVPVRNENELRSLFHTEPTEKIWWWPKFSEKEEVFRSIRTKLGVNWRGSRQYRLLEGQKKADKAINDLMANLSRCSPEVRRAFVARMQDIRNLVID